MINKLAKNVLFELKEYLDNTPREQIDRDIKEIDDMYPPGENEEDGKFSFICTDPDCPHCAYDERYVTDSEIDEQARGEVVNDDLSWEVDYAREAFIKGARWVRDEYEKVRRGDTDPQK